MPCMRDVIGLGRLTLYNVVNRCNLEILLFGCRWRLGRSVQPKAVITYVVAYSVDWLLSGAADCLVFVVKVRDFWSNSPIGLNSLKWTCDLFHVLLRRGRNCFTVPLFVSFQTKKPKIFSSTPYQTKRPSEVIAATRRYSRESLHHGEFQRHLLPGRVRVSSAKTC